MKEMEAREIKFRAWNKQTRRMEDNFSLDNDGSRIFTQEGSRDFFFQEPYEDVEQKDWVLMQFTGLLDKNGKEIYESDIVSRKERIGVIGWNDGGFCIDTVKIEGKFVEYREPFFTQPIMEGWEVIGNIFENSELISK